MSELGEKVKELRLGLNWTKKQVSENSGISTPVLTGIEKGTYKPSDLMIGRLAKVFNYDFNELLKLKGR